MIPKKCDVAIIGGGPGGSLAGTFLSQMGYDVVLFEKKKHPRYHVGESLIPDFWRYCDEAGVSAKIEAEGFVQKAGGNVEWDGVMRKIAFKDFGYTRPALHVERDRFDEILIEHAREQGTQVFEEISVLRVDFNDSHGNEVIYQPVGEETTSKIKCRFVIDASGQNAVIGKQLDLRVMDEAFRFLSVWGYFEGASYLGTDGEVYPAEQVKTTLPTTYVTSIPEADNLGWAWHIMLQKRTSVGLVLPREFVKGTKEKDESWEHYFLRQCQSLPRMSRLLSTGHFCKGSVSSIPNYSYRSTQLTGPGYFLIGDAAGFVDPVFSIGVVLSMYSAYMSAWAIDRCFKEPERTEEYQESFTQQIQSRFELARSLALPRYQITDRMSDQTKEAAGFMSMQSKELMQAAASTVGRSTNYKAIVNTQT
jgi:flavin-dependent dehydrogenase